MFVYKFLELDDRNELDFFKVEILTENELRERFLYYYRNNLLNEKNLDYYELKGVKKEFILDPDGAGIDQIFNCLCDDGSYHKEQFLLEQIEIYGE